MSEDRQPAFNKEELHILLVSTAEGDTQAFARLVDAFWNNVYAHALAYIRSAQLAEEATQDVFVKIWDSRTRLPQLDSFENFLFIVARNYIISAMRKKYHNVGDRTAGDSIENIWQPDQQLAYKELYEALLGAIEQMPLMRRRVFSLSRLEGLSHGEISSRLGISRNTVKEHIVKGLNFLKSYLNNNPERMLVILLAARVFLYAG